MVGARERVRARNGRVSRGTERAFDGRREGRVGGSLEPRRAALCAGRARHRGEEASWNPAVPKSETPSKRRAFSAVDVFRESPQSGSPPDSPFSPITLRHPLANEIPSPDEKLRGQIPPPRARRMQAIRVTPASGTTPRPPTPARPPRTTRTPRSPGASRRADTPRATSPPRPFSLPTRARKPTRDVRVFAAPHARDQLTVRRAASRSASPAGTPWICAAATPSPRARRA